MKLPQELYLRGKLCSLEPMDGDCFEELYHAGSDPNIWKFMPIRGWDSNTAAEWHQEALRQRALGIAAPFVIRHNPSGKIIGSTRLQDFQALHRTVEIGWSWLNPGYWETGINNEAKQLLLNCAFERLQVIRVGFKTDERNIRSQKALIKLGAQFEGIRRNHMIRPDGTYRNSYYYSITVEDWKTRNERKSFSANFDDIYVRFIPVGG